MTDYEKLLGILKQRLKNHERWLSLAEIEECSDPSVNWDSYIDDKKVIICELSDILETIEELGIEEAYETFC